MASVQESSVLVSLNHLMHLEQQRLREEDAARDAALEVARRARLDEEQRVRAEHLTHCQRRWGVGPQSSGWGWLREQAWQGDALAAVGCVAVVLHPWWI